MSASPAGAPDTLRIGTRGSALALAQATLVGQALDAIGIAHETIVIETAGDRRAPDTAWGEGAFVGAIEQALVEGRVDVAVHSAKDVPTDEDARLHIAAYLPREQPLDALVLPDGRSGSIDDLAPGTVIGTDSPRRTGFLRAHRPDLRVMPLHGNVDTRLRRLDEGAVDALVLAAAGLLRLARGGRISQLLPVEVVPPAPGQGAIAVQVRANDARARALAQRVDDPPTRQAVEAERAFLLATGGGCRAPVGALATVAGDSLELLGGFATLDGRATSVERRTGAVSDGARLASELAALLSARRARLPGAPRVLLTRPAGDSHRLAGRLAEQGIASEIAPTIEIELLDQSPALSEALTGLAGFDWAVVTSANGARAARRAAQRLGVDLSVTRWAAVGRTTARELLAAGVADAWLPGQSSAAAIAAELPLADGRRVLWLRGDLAEDSLIERLAERGAQVAPIVAYRTREAPAASFVKLAAAMERGVPDAVVLASPSAVSGLLALAGNEDRARLLAVPAICVGPRTAHAAGEAGFATVRVAPEADAASLAELAAQLLFEQPRREYAPVTT